MKLLAAILAVILDGIIPSGPAYLKQLQQRDSVLIADQIEYGFQLDGVKSGTEIALPDFSEVSNDTLFLLRNWKIDTLKVQKKKGTVDIRGSVVLVPFEEGTYELPQIPVLRKADGVADTLIFDSQVLEVKTMPVDTATFEIHDIKGQVRYPLTLAEILPYVQWALLIVSALILVVYFILRSFRKKEEDLHKDPAYIVALRQLDRYHSDKFWAPEKQKSFYSGVTDTLKAYIEDRFGVDAPEMTTAELFAELKSDKDITPELFNEMKNLFETADFVKFAKHVAPDEENAKVVPLAVRFVTSTYQAQLEEEVE